MKLSYWLFLDTVSIHLESLRSLRTEAVAPKVWLESREKKIFSGYGMKKCEEIKQNFYERLFQTSNYEHDGQKLNVT